MKPIDLLAIIFLLCPGFSCDEKNEPPPKTELEILKERMIGRWEGIIPDYNRVITFYENDTLFVSQMDYIQYKYSYSIVSRDSIRLNLNDIITKRKFFFSSDDTLTIERFLMNDIGVYEDYTLVKQTVGLAPF